MHSHDEIPRPPHLPPPKKKLLDKLIPKRRFFENLKPAAIVRRERRDEMQAGQSRIPKNIKWGIAGLVVLFVVGSAISLVIAKRHVASSIAARANTLQAGIADLQNFDTTGAAAKFSSLNGGISALGSLISGGSGALGSFGDLTKQLTLLSQQVEVLKTDLFAFLGGGGAGAGNGGGGGSVSSTTTAPNSLVSDLTALRAQLAAIDADTNQLSSAASFMGSSSPLTGDDYVSLKTQLTGAENFLDVFVPWLAAPAPHHVLVLLQNPSELRATGGFLGSYADITLASGTIANIAVHDIADADAAFKPNIVPPKPLQLEVSRFRPADANWFFDFPTSASETIAMFERAASASSSPTSYLLSPISSSYDGVIAISPKIISDLLGVTGSIAVDKTKFTTDNLLLQIQNLVQQGQATAATYPKQVLRDLASAMFQQLASSTDAQKQALLATALNWVGDKEVMAYFKDPGFENFLMNYGATGEVYALPQKFNGDYLAVVDTNINGQKSDLYVSSTVSWVAQLAEDGTVQNELSITRAHHGDMSPYWWYKAPNQDYMQIFVPDGSVLTNESGGAKKTIVPPINYAKNAFVTDPLIAAIESSTRSFFNYPAVTSHEESGKEVFATWARVAAGQLTKILFSYAHHLFIAPAQGVAYQFVFEKQAGTVRSYSFEIDAPLGYVFAESGISSWTLKTDDPPGRMIVNLTLEKL